MDPACVSTEGTWNMQSAQGAAWPGQISMARPLPSQTRAEMKKEQPGTELTRSLENATLGSCCDRRA